MSADDFFSGGAKSASFKGNFPITWSGVITQIGEEQQMHEYDPRKPGNMGDLKWWDPETKTRPMKHLPITIQTDVRDPADAQDDGQRVIWYSPGEKKKAMGAALRGAGLRGPRVGDWTSLTYYGNDPQSKNPDNPKKLYKAEYAVRPSDFFEQGEQPAPAAQTSSQPPAQPFPGQVHDAPAAPAPAPAQTTAPAAQQPVGAASGRPW